MSLNLRLLEKTRELANGIVQARCPACAEGGGDRAGEHLRIYADGRFGCCVHPKDGEHRKRIFALAGDKKPRSFTVKVATSTTPPSATSVASALASFRGTLGTAKTESVTTIEQPSQEKQPEETIITTLGTLGTPLFNPHTYAREEEQFMGDDTPICKGSENAVPSVPSSLPPSAGRMPYLTPGGVLGIPFDSPERFHWWKGGQSIAETRAEVEQWIRETAGKESHGAGV